MQAQSYDVVIVGAGVAGALIATRLAKAGVKVVIVEAGPRTDRDTAVNRFRAGGYPYVSPEWAPQPSVSNLEYYYVQTGPEKFGSDYERRVGGTTWHWLGNCPRLLPSDFQMKTRFGVGHDWPLTYDELEPWYGQAETELGVAGDSKADVGSPRTTPYPMPAIPLASGDAMFAEAAKKLGLTLVATPQARNSVDGYQGRKQCCGNAMCIPICPIQAKYDATVHIALAEQAGARVLENSVAFRIDVDTEGKVSGIRYKTSDRAEHTITGRIYIIAANGIETPKLLLISTSEATPHGVANSSDLVGRNLCDHPETSASAMAPQPYAGSRGPLQLSGIDQVREGDFRNKRAAIRLQVQQSVGDPVRTARTYIAQGLSGKALFDKLGQTVPYQVTLASMVEQLPDPENRVTVDEKIVDAFGIPRPKLAYRYDEYTLQGKAAARQLHQQLMDGIGATGVVHEQGLHGVGHLMSTYLMGDDPKQSVTDSFGRTHDHPNLYLAGSGLFPTTGTANPTLTIAALALRAAEQIGRELGVIVAGTPSASPVASPVATPAS